MTSLISNKAPFQPRTGAYCKGALASDRHIRYQAATDPTKVGEPKTRLCMIARHRLGSIASRSRAFSGTILPIIFLLVLLSGCAPAPMIDASLRARAIEGDARAQYEIGERFRMAYYDSFTPFSSSLFLWEEAVKWYELAANQGYGKAQYQLSVFYFTFRDDYDRSFYWAQKAALQGIAEAQASLGLHYAQAWGTPQDLILAYQWIALGFEGKLQDPIGKAADLEWLVKRGQLSPAQIGEGRRLAAAYTTAHGRSRSILLIAQPTRAVRNMSIGCSPANFHQSPMCFLALPGDHHYSLT